MNRQVNKKIKKKVIASLIIIIIFIFTNIGVIFLMNKTTENQNRKVNSKIEEKDDYKIVSKYNPNIKEYQDVKIKIDKIVRGEEADNLLEKYNKNSSYKVDIQKKDEEELLLVEYEIDFMDFEMSKIGANKDVSVNICKNEEKAYIEYNNNIYSPLVECINNDEFTNEKKAKGKFVTTIPKGCTDYKIKIGVEGQNVAYFDGI